MPTARAAAVRPLVSAEIARRLLLDGQGLLADPARRTTPAAIHRQIERMGFVQVDTINVLDRAHHHILRTRFDGYEPRMLEKLLERDRKLFEHWTHDASIIPAGWLPWWRVRFRRYDELGHGAETWWHERMKGDPAAVIASVLARVEREGPLMSKDFERDPEDGRDSAWWGWRPEKAALEYLWRTGRLVVTARRNFHKVYDLADRVFPELHDGAPPAPTDHVDWACTAALERLGVATPAELAGFLAAVKLPAAAAWCREATARGDVIEVLVESTDGAKPRRAVARPDWERRAARVPEAPARMRLLSPFDPVVRDRKRAQRLFGFDYRFEAFVPAAKRKYGYYVLPILERDRFVGRLDAKVHRDRSELEVKGLWWEPGVRVTTQRRRLLDDALNRLAAGVGATTWGRGVISD